MHIVTQVIKEPDERIVLRKESPSPLDSSKFGKPSPSYGNPGNADFHREASFAAYQPSRSSSPLLDQPLLRERSAASTRLFVWRVCCGLVGVKPGHFTSWLPDECSAGDRKNHHFFSNLPRRKDWAFSLACGKHISRLLKMGQTANLA